MKLPAQIGLVIIGVLLAVFLAKPILEFIQRGSDTPVTSKSQSLLSSSAIFAPDNAAFNARQVLFINQNEHPLSRRIGTELLSRLKNSSVIPHLDEMKTPASGYRKTVVRFIDGSRAPDLFLRIDLLEIKETEKPSRTLKTILACSLGDAPWDSNRRFQNAVSPPVAQWNWQTALEHEATFHGIPRDPYGAPAKSLADELAKLIEKEITKVAAQKDSLPPLPDYLYGPYETTPELGFVQETKARRVYSYHGLFTHNETFWNFHLSQNPVLQLRNEISRLEKDGWKLENSSLINTEDYYASFTRDEATLEFFLPAEKQLDSLSSRLKPTTPFVARYRKLFSPREREEALEKLLAEKIPVETLLPFESSFSAAQRKRFYSRLEEAASISVPACMRLAEYHWQRQDTNAALQMLTRAKEIATSATNKPILEAKIESVARKISPKTRPGTMKK